MFCSKCGAEIDDAALVCPKCGCATQNYSEETNPVKKTKSIKPLLPIGIVLLVVGVIGLIVGYVKTSEASSARLEIWKDYSHYESSLRANMYVYGNEDGYRRFRYSDDFDNYKKLKEKYDYYNSQVGTGIVICVVTGVLATSGLVLIILAKKKKTPSLETTSVAETTLHNQTPPS